MNRKRCIEQYANFKIKNGSDSDKITICSFCPFQIMNKDLFLAVAIGN